MPAGEKRSEGHGRKGKRGNDEELKEQPEERSVLTLMHERKEEREKQGKSGQDRGESMFKTAGRTICFHVA